MRNVPANMADRLILALDVTNVDEARALVAQLSGAISFFKIGLGLLFAPGVDRLMDDLIGAGHRVFLDAKMYDIPETVSRGITVAATRGVSLITIHGDEAIIRGRHRRPRQRRPGRSSPSPCSPAWTTRPWPAWAPPWAPRRWWKCAPARPPNSAATASSPPPHDNPNEIRALAGNPNLLIATPGVRQSTGDLNDHKRSATPAAAIRNGADYLVVGRPIIKAENPLAAAHAIIAEMESA